MLTLVVSHNIGLTKEERYNLFEGKTVDVFGVSVPVWFRKGNTSEPANEVFVKYKLTNQKKTSSVKITKEGYEINLPQPKLSENNLDEEILDVTGVNKELPTAKNLLDMKDGGTEFIQFRQFSKSNLTVDGNKTKISLNVIHCVEIRPIEDVINTLA